jgi:hypothetical protein
LIEFVDHKGSFRNTTVRGQITGMELNLGIIDDFVKGRAEAGSKNDRDKTWNWFTDDSGKTVHSGGYELGRGGTQPAEANGVSFSGGGMVQLDSLLSQFGGVISGFDLGDEIGPHSLGFGSSSSATSWRANAGAPGVDKGGNTFNLTLLGQYAAANFNAGADGHGGTLITDPSASSSVAQTPLVAHH